MPGQDGARRRSAAGLAANRPIAAAVRFARGPLSQREFVEALRAAGYPASEDMLSGWELGADPDSVASVSGITIVPAWALVAAAVVARRTVGELLTMAGVEGQEPLIDQLARLKLDHERLVAAVDELRAHAGLPSLPQQVEDTEATED